MATDRTGASQVVLILAPTGRDADLAVSVLSTAKIAAKTCQNVSELAGRLRKEGASIAALLLTEESLSSAADCASLTAWIEQQEPWSDLPIVFLARAGGRTQVTKQRLRVLGRRGSVTVLQRPVHPSTLLSSLSVGLQSRERQHQLRDLLESQRRASIELQKARLDAESANQAKDRFLAILSHELRTPLNAMLGWTRLMKESRNDESLVAQGVEVLQRNIATFVKLLSDLADISRIVSDTLTLEFRDVDLKQIVVDSVDGLLVQAASKGIALEVFVEVPKEVSCRVRADKSRLHQILANLLNNALKFTPPEGSISVRLKKAHATAVVVVKDTGKGISPEFLPRLFQRFSQEDTSPGENHGMGLGLAICKHLVELHGGSITAESQGSGRGALFRVELPTVESNRAPSAERERECVFAKEDEMFHTKLKSITVVAVDDNSDSRELLKIILEGAGAEAKVVGSGEEALAAIKNARPDILICDLAMPVMDGYELLQNVRALEPEIGWLPTIAFTAAARIEDRVLTQRAGFQAHLAKPVDPSELIATVFELTTPRRG
jgi:signal transduction histidine kinase/CheY-like chemotaxis protein